MLETSNRKIAAKAHKCLR